MADTARQFEKPALARAYNHIVSLSNMPSGTAIGGGLIYATITDPRRIPASVGAAGTAVAITSVDAAANTFTLASHGLQNGQALQFTTSGTLPAGLALSTTYYVVNTATNTWQVSTQVGGLPVDMTDAGSGTHNFVVPANNPYLLYNGSMQYFPVYASVASKVIDAAANDLSVTATIYGIDFMGNRITYRFTNKADAATTGTIDNSNVPFMGFDKIEIAKVGTAAAGDSIGFGLHGGSSSWTRASYGVPLKKASTGMVERIVIGTTIVRNPTITNGCILATADMSASNAPASHMIINPAYAL